MARLLLIETSTVLCSTAVCEDGTIIAYREDTGRQHSALTAVFIKEMLEQTGLRVQDMDAVCVGMGPGSYTGLRVGSSTAKGLCFGAGIPLLAVSSLDTLVGTALAEGLVPEGCSAIVPMVDARRMEVFTAVYTPDGLQATPIEAKVVREDSFTDQRSEGKVLFIGDGAMKCASVLQSDNSIFVERFPSAKGMCGPAQLAFEQNKWQDVAYFEPFYLKEFVATVSHKKLF